jgi:glycosyltransferase involved in cell wall biosynthesis
MIIGIDACNIRSGGGLTHLNEILKHSDPVKQSFTKIVVWTNKCTIEKLPTKEWIDYKSSYLLNKGAFFAFLFQIIFLRYSANKNSCKIILVPGGVFLSNFRPYVAISQNLLPFELNEAFRYSSNIYKLRFIILRFLQKRTFKNANGLIFLTNYAKSIILKTTSIPENNIIIPHGIDLAKSIKPKENILDKVYTLENPFKLLYVSIIAPYKHQWTISEAVSKLYLEGYPIKLILVGPSEESSLKKLNKVLKDYESSSNCIDYVGAVAHDKLFNYYENADGFIFGSSCENLPIILIEAMSMGLPILSSSKGPMMEVLGENENCYFDPENLSDIMDRIKHFYNNPNLRGRISNSSYLKSIHFSWLETSNETFKFLIKSV